MKTIATAGKGGTGKTSILAGLLIRHLLITPFPRLLVVDADPHQCLTSLLAEAYHLTPAPSLGELRQANEARLRFGEDLQTASRSDFAAYLVEQALTPLPGGHHLLTMGVNERPGCQCVVNNLLGRALDALAENYNLAAVDNEAGIEPIGRHAWPIDFLILTASPRPLDLQIAFRILEQARQVGREVRDVVMAFNFCKNGIPIELSERLGKDIRQVVTFPEVSGYMPRTDANWQAALGRLEFLRKGSW